MFSVRVTSFGRNAVLPVRHRRQILTLLDERGRLPAGGAGLEVGARKNGSAQNGG